MVTSITVLFRRAVRGPSIIWAALTRWPLAGREERHRFENLIFHVDERVFFQRDAPVGLPLGIRLHGVATLLSVGEAFVLPEMHDTVKRPDVRDKETIGLTEVFSLQRQRHALVSLQKPVQPVRLNRVDTVVDD